MLESSVQIDRVAGASYRAEAQLIIQVPARTLVQSPAPTQRELWSATFALVRGNWGLVLAASLMAVLFFGLLSGVPLAWKFGVVNAGLAALFLGMITGPILTLASARREALRRMPSVERRVAAQHVRVTDDALETGLGDRVARADIEGVEMGEDLRSIVVRAGGQRIRVLGDVPAEDVARAKEALDAYVMSPAGSLRAEAMNDIAADE